MVTFSLREKLDRDKNKIYEKEEEYTKLQNNTRSITDLVLEALDDPVVIQKLREKLKEQKIDVNHQRKE
ncbi:MAG: hypothetical protein PHW36_00635 [Bacilli bacterium]|nr:hypothetical protein [Bacilli bacterium]